MSAAPGPAAPAPAARRWDDVDDLETIIPGGPLPPSKDPNVAVHMRNVTKTYLLGVEGVAALRGVSCTINRGDFVVILGRSGGGKTSMLNILGTIDRPTRGDLYLCGTRVDSDTPDSALADIRLRRLGFVFQTFNLLPGLTAVENVELPMVLAGWGTRSSRRKRALKLLARVGLRERAEHVPSMMSGGEQQRTTIARALANKPDILLLDEPTGDLDGANSAIVMSILTRLNRREGVTCIMVTHDVALKAYAHRVLHMVDGKIARIESISPLVRMEADEALAAHPAVVAMAAVEDNARREARAMRRGLLVVPTPTAAALAAGGRAAGATATNIGSISSGAPSLSPAGATAGAASVSTGAGLLSAGSRQGLFASSEAAHAGSSSGGRGTGSDSDDDDSDDEDDDSDADTRAGTSAAGKAATGGKPSASYSASGAFASVGRWLGLSPRASTSVTSPTNVPNPLASSSASASGVGRPAAGTGGEDVTTVIELPTATAASSSAPSSSTAAAPVAMMITGRVGGGSYARYVDAAAQAEAAAGGGASATSSGGSGIATAGVAATGVTSTGLSGVAAISHAIFAQSALAGTGDTGSATALAGAVAGGGGRTVVRTPASYAPYLYSQRYRAEQEEQRAQREAAAASREAALREAFIAKHGGKGIMVATA